MALVDDTLASNEYDEFSFLHENAQEWGIPFDGSLEVVRHHFELSSGQRLSYIRWGIEDPEIILLHGGGQNAHTWDTVALALSRPAVAIDLPGHGHSDRRADRDYGPWCNTDALTELLPSVAPSASVVVGMSLGGATTLRLAAVSPELCRRGVIIDVTPQINDPTRDMTTMERGSVALIRGPPVYDSFEEMAAAAITLSPLRGSAGVRRGVRHNAIRLDDGSWTWRYDLFAPSPGGAKQWSDFTPLWEDVSAISVPTLFVQGGESRYVRDEDIAEMGHRLPSMTFAVVEGAGHAVQSDRPLELARLILEFTSD